MNRNINFSLTYTQTHTKIHYLKCKVLFLSFSISHSWGHSPEFFLCVCARLWVHMWVTLNTSMFVSLRCQLNVTLLLLARSGWVTSGMLVSLHFRSAANAEDYKNPGYLIFRSNLSWNPLHQDMRDTVWRYIFIFFFFLRK